MFKDNMMYSAVLFKHKDITSIQSFCDSFSNNVVSKPSVLSEIVTKDFSAAHFYYLTPTVFSKSPDLEQVFENGVYRYDFYYFHFRSNDEVFSILAVPWFKMGVELFEYLGPKSLSSDFSTTFYKADLLGLIDSLKLFRDDNLTLLSSNFSIEGESNVETLNISGSNPLYSELFTEIHELVTLKPNKCKIIHEKEKTRDLRLSLDNLGNIQFRVGVTVSNLSKLQDIFEIIMGRNLLHPIEGFYNPMKLRLNISNNDE